MISKIPYEAILYSNMENSWINTINPSPRASYYEKMENSWINTIMPTTEQGILMETPFSDGL